VAFVGMGVVAVVGFDVGGGLVPPEHSGTRSGWSHDMLFGFQYKPEGHVLSFGPVRSHL
jgi:hypothetical protein